MEDERTYLVDGMSCDHCRHAITEAVTGLDGVETVDVRVDSGMVVVTGAPAPAGVREAIMAAGYEVTGVR